MEGRSFMRRLGQAMAMLIALAVTAGVVHAGPTPGAKCAVAKEKAAVKKIAAKLKCWEKAVATGASSADSGCLMAAETKFGTALMKAGAKGGCVRTDDAATIESTVDTFVNTILAETPSKTCQTANLTCVCTNGASTSFFPACGSPAVPDCSTERNQATQFCSLNSGRPDDCASLGCTDACTGEPCG
jgi:hypothetical protein